MPAFHPPHVDLPGQSPGHGTYRGFPLLPGDAKALAKVVSGSGGEHTQTQIGPATLENPVRDERPGTVSAHSDDVAIALSQSLVGQTRDVFLTGGFRVIKMQVTMQEFEPGIPALLATSAAGTRVKENKKSLIGQRAGL
jgi:hypothetical protein